MNILFLFPEKKYFALLMLLLFKRYQTAIDNIEVLPITFVHKLEDTEKSTELVKFFLE